METKYFRISAGRYVRQAITIWIGQWWWLVFTPLVILIVCGLYNPIFFIAAISMALIVYPGLMMLVYYNYALRTEAALAIVPHKISIDDEAVHITYQESDEYPTTKPRHIPMSDVENIEDTGSALLVHLKSGKYDFIEIPNDVIITR